MISQCKIVELPKFCDVRGNLTFIQSRDKINFDIHRIYYSYDVPAGVERGGHAHKNLHQLIIAVSGSFDIKLHDGKDSEVYTLNKPYEGLYVCPMIWREIYNFSSGSVCLVVASLLYDENDYIRSFLEFKNLCQGQS